MTNNSIQISIVVPVYNKAKYLSKCIDSIINQAYKYFEIILVDDGSTDNSGKICDTYSDKYPNIKVFHKQNSGVSAARNYGIERAAYDYIAFLDSDDYWDQGFLSEIVMLISKYPDCGMFSTGFYYVRKDKIISNNNILIGDYIVDNYFKHSLEHTFVNSSNVVIKSEILKQIGMFPVGMIDAEDLYTWAKAASVCKCAYSNKKLSYYNLISEGWRMRKNRKDIDGYSFTQLIDKDPYKKKYLSLLAYRKSVYYLINGFRSEADKQIAPFLKGNIFSSNMIRYRIFRLLPQRYIYTVVQIDVSITRRIKRLKDLFTHQEKK